MGRRRRLDARLGCRDPGGAHVVQAVAERLAAAGCVAAAEEAAELEGAAPDAVTLADWVARRERGEPLAWITGSTVFCGRRLHIAPGVFVPRPQTEELACRAAAALPAGGRAVDLCTGAGAVAVHLQATVPGARVLGVDVDQEAAACAWRNGVAVVVGDVAHCIRARKRVDVLTAVAPYVPTNELRFLPADSRRHEPRAALDGGPDGLRVVRRVVAAARLLLRPGGTLLLELGGDQADRLDLSGFGEVTVWHDEDGDLRGLAAVVTVAGRK